MINNIENNEYGIGVDYCEKKNEIIKNNITNNSVTGIYVANSYNNKIFNNTVTKSN